MQIHENKDFAHRGVPQPVIGRNPASAAKTCARSLRQNGRTAIAQADLRDDEDADEFAATGQILVATFATFLAMSLVAFRLSPKNRTLPSMSRSSSTFPSLSVNLQ